MLSRHAAGSFELKEGTGAITAMQPCGEFLEIYKIDKTFRVKSPESIDPEETNPNALWMTAPFDDVGSGNPRWLYGFIDVFNTKLVVIRCRDAAGNLANPDVGLRILFSVIGSPLVVPT